MSVTPIRLLRARRKSLRVFVVAVSVLASCGAPDKFELTLRTRDDDGQVLYDMDRSWLAADGRHATSPPHSGDLLVDLYKTGDVECGGQKWPRHFFSVLGPELLPEDKTFELTIDDGNRLTLDPHTAVIVGSYYTTDCLEETGHWRGTAGDLRDHEGTFTIHYDSIQTVLRLVED